MNKKEIKSTAVRRRGTTIAAAALSVALVAPFVHPVVSPQSAAEAQAQTSGTVAATPVTDPTKIIEADGIANGYIGSRFDMTNALATLSGVVGLKETSASSSLKGTMGINDATVYMQFKDRDGTISPIFSTKSHQLGSSSGNYVFDLRAKGEDGNLLSHPDSEVPGGEYSFVDANGKPHLFRALRGQEYRIWVDSPLKNEETGNDLTYVRQAGGGVPGAWAPVTQGTANGAFYFENYNMQRTGVFLEERAPSVDEKSYMVSPDFSMDEEGWAQPSGTKAPRFSYFGRVWSDAEGGPDRNETGPLYWWKGDQPIEGAKVYASVLSDEGVAEFERLAIADKPYREQAAATKSMIENMRANGKEPILKTVGAETNADGRYTIRMGDDIGRRMKDYTYIWAEKDGKVLNSFSGFPTPVFQSVNANSGENPNSDGAVGIASFTNHRWYNINFAEVQADIVNLDIVNYDSFLNPADLPEGINNLEPANIKLTGALPFSGNNKIRWIGPDGKQIGEDCAVDTLADAANCSLAPEDFNNPGTYVAQLVNAYDVVVGQDSFIAVDKVRQNGEFEPQYEDATVPAGKKTTVDAPKDKDGQEIPEGTTFEPGGQVTDPEGNKVDKPEWITVNPDGSIEVEPPKDAKPGDYTIPVVVTYPDGSRETIEAKVTVEKPDAPESKKTTVDGDVKPVDPSNDPQDTGVKVTNPDDDTKISAKDEDGKDVPVEIDEDGKVIVTPGTDVDGPITVTITDPDLPDGKVDVEVPVNGHEKGKDDNGSEETPAPDASVVTDKVTVVEGQEADPFDTAKDVPENGKVEVDGLPDGLTVDEKTGEVSGTPDKITDWGKDEEERDFEVTVTITDEDGNKAAEDTKVITVQRDTDGDGEPDVTDTDDDGDGATDEEEKEAGTDPKDPNSKPETPVNPDASVVTDKVTVVEGQEADPFDTAKDVPENGKVEVDGLPDGLTVDEKTGEVSGTPDKITDWGKDEEERDFEVTVTITDEDGNKAAEDTKVITVQRDTDGDGEPDVTDTDDDGDGATDEEEKEAGTDPKDPNSKPSEEQPGDNPTEVDDSGVKPVDPTDEEQDTGIKVTNPDDDTKVSATDEDGKDIPVEIDENGNVVVTPGTDVDGPINVVVEDPDLDGGKTEIEVEVNGHEKDRDDNGSEASDKTTVDDSGVKPVDPTDEEQDTGIKVTNPDDDTKVSATDEDGKDIPVEIDENGNVVVTPGTDVDGPINVVVEDPDLDGGKAEIEVPVEGHDKGRDDNKKPAKPGKDLSSKPSERCINTGLGVGIPLLFLIPVGLASQMNIPGLSDFVAPINKQIRDLNTQLQKQAGVFNGPLAGKMAGIDAQLKRFGVDHQQAAGAVALIAAGALAIGLIADACAPGAGSSNGSSK